MTSLTRHEDEGLWVEMFSLMLARFEEEGKEDLVKQISVMPYDAKQHFVYTDLLQKADEGHPDAIRLLKVPALTNFIKTKIN